MRESNPFPLQRIQNAAARLVTRSRPYEHINPILRNLHWLPVIQSIQYKILLLAFKIRNGECPTYLFSLVKSKPPSSRLRASTSSLFQLIPGPRVKTRYGDRALSLAVPSCGIASRPTSKMLLLYFFFLSVFIVFSEKLTE